MEGPAFVNNLAGVTSRAMRVIVKGCGHVTHGDDHWLTAGPSPDNVPPDGVGRDVGTARAVAPEQDGADVLVLAGRADGGCDRVRAHGAARHQQS